MSKIISRLMRYQFSVKGAVLTLGALVLIWGFTPSVTLAGSDENDIDISNGPEVASPAEEADLIHSGDETLGEDNHEAVAENDHDAVAENDHDAVAENDHDAVAENDHDAVAENDHDAVAENDHDAVAENDHDAKGNETGDH
jgi:hypothetical protein